MKRAAMCSLRPGLRLLLVTALLVFENAAKPADSVVARVSFGAQEHAGETIDRLGRGVTLNRVLLKPDVS